MRKSYLTFAVAVMIATLFTSCMTMETINMEDEPLILVYDDLRGNQNQLYLKANEWMVKTFGNAESVIQHNDKEDGVMIGKYLMYGTVVRGAYGTQNDTRVFSVIDIRVKDNRARISIQPQGSWAYDKSGMTIFKYDKLMAQADMDRLASEFKTYMMGSDVDF